MEIKLEFLKMALQIDPYALVACFRWGVVAFYVSLGGILVFGKWTAQGLRQGSFP